MLEAQQAVGRNIRGPRDRRLGHNYC
jgi:Rad3-related DNA helicase